MTIGQLHFQVTSFIRQSPALFFPLMRINKRLRRIQGAPLVDKNSEVVIEGFFRTGNTFAARAFLEAQPKKVKIATHTHAAASVIRAVELGKPTIVLTRQAEDTVLSLKLKHPHITMQQGLKVYLRYHKTILPYREGYVVGTFKQVTTDYGIVIECLNQHIGTEFLPFEHNQAAVNRVFDHIEGIDRVNENWDATKYAIQTPEKEHAKAELREKLHDESLRPLVKEADGLYRELVVV